VKDLAAIIKRFESPYVGVCLDTVNSFGALEHPEQVVSELAPYVLSLHIKDFDIKRIESKMGFSIIGSPAGEGRLDIDGIIEQVRKCGKNPNIILELWTPFCENIENTIVIEAGWALKSIRFLMKYETNRVPEFC
jgi:sugar phosphate isomerase/epimerase